MLGAISLGQEREFILRQLYTFLLCVFLPCVALADDADKKDEQLYLSIRRIGLEMSTTKIGNAAEYADSPVSALSATSQDYIKGISDIALEYNKNKFKWDNSLFMEYGRTTLKPYNGPETTDENADKILLSSDLSYACWNWAGLKFGPTVRGAYETQFIDNNDAPRQNILRTSMGISLFDHKIIKSLYLMAFTNMTLHMQVNKPAKQVLNLGGDWNTMFAKA